MKIEVQTNFPQVMAKLAELEKNLGAQVLARSLNRTLDIAKTEMSKRIRAEFDLSASYVRERLSIKRAFAKTGLHTLSAELMGGKGRKRSANVINFKARKTADGVSILIKKGQRKTIKNAFIGNKGRTVFEREGKSRLPIKPVQTIDVAQMFNTRRINAAVQAAMRTRFPAIFERELSHALRSFKKT